MDGQHETVTIYEPDDSLRKGYLAIFPDIYRELRDNRWLVRQLAKRDLLAAYKQSFIGILWAVIIPLVSVGTFIALNRSGVFSLGETDVPYAIYAVLGMCLWQLFAMGLIACSNSLVNAGAMIVKINFSKKSLVVASMGQSLVSFAVQLVILGILFAVYAETPRAEILLTSLFAIPVIMFSLGLGLIFSLLNGISRDVGNAIAVLVTFLLFLTPVLYPLPAEGGLAAVSRYNPLYYLVAIPRDFILTGSAVGWTGYAISAAVALAVLIVCTVAFHLTETRVAERI